MGFGLLAGSAGVALLLVLGPRVLPEYRDPNAGRLDILSAVMSLVAVLAMIYGLKETAQDGFGWSRLPRSSWAWSSAFCS